MRRPTRRSDRPGEKYASEAALCAFFSERARAGGWRVYPETADYDMLCVAGPDVKGGFHEGDQIGVEAKLRGNLTVLAQLVEHQRTRGRHPHFFLALVPWCTREFMVIARHLLFSVLTGARLEDDAAKAIPFDRRDFVKHLSPKPCWEPECEPLGMCGGKSGPERLTEWKIKAVKLCVHGVHQGYLTKHDFLAHGVSMARWLKTGWIVPFDDVADGKKRTRLYALVAEKRPPHLRYPEVTVALAKAGEL